MTPHKYFYVTYKPVLARRMFMGDNDMVEATGKGSILLVTRVKDHVWSIRMNDVLYVPDLHSNLFP